MLTSIVTIVLFMTGMLGLLLYPKAQGRLNGIKMLVMGTMAIFCYLAFLAGIYKLIGIPIKLWATCVSLAVMNVFLWGGILRKRKVQRLFFRWADVVCLLFLAAFVLGIALHLFTPELKLQYQNIDAANHFLYANVIVKYGDWSFLTYFSAYIDAVFIQILSPMLSPILYFKAFILADIFMHVLEIWMFYCLVLTISDRKSVRIMAPFLSIGYFWGYPAYSFMEGNFVYWSNGVMIFILILYALLLIERYEGLRRYSVPLLLLGAYANLFCNKLYVPTNTFAILVIVAVIVLEKRWEKINKKRLCIGVAAGFAALVIAGGACLYLGQDKLAGLVADLIKDGGIYRCLYADLIFFLPVLIYVLWYAVKNRSYEKTIPAASISMILVALGMYIVMRMELMSIYYFYKSYYNLWLMGWLLAAAALGIMAKKKQLAWYFSYAGMIGLLCGISMADYDTLVKEAHEDYNGEYATAQMFSLYRYNRENLLKNYKTYRISDMTLDIYNYAMEQMSDVDVRAIPQSAPMSAWHDSLDLAHAKGYDFSDYELTELLHELDENGVQAVIVQLDDEKYEAYQGYFDWCIQVCRNEDAAIVMPPDGTWLAVPQSVADISQDKIELYDYVAEHYSGEDIPLMADRSAYFDYILYYMETGNEVKEVYPWNVVTSWDIRGLSQEETAWVTAQKTTNALKENDISYIVVLNGDKYYELVDEYMESWEVVYENDAGKVLAVETEDE